MKPSVTEKIPVKTLNNGFFLPVIGLGGWLLGGTKERFGSEHDEADVAAVRRALEAGITHIDTAEVYAAGWSERIIGRAIKGFDRNSLSLATKVNKIHLHHDDVIASVEQSLERLNVSYIDLCYIHSPNLDIPIKETMRSLDELVDRGLIRNIGVSNFTVERFEAAQSCSRNKIVANQLNYNVRFREVEKIGLVEYCQSHDVLLVAWRPLNIRLSSGVDARVVSELAKKYHKTSVQISINWLITQRNVVAIIGMKDPLHLQENLGAVGWAMEKGDIEYLRKEFPGQIFVSDGSGPLR